MFAIYFFDLVRQFICGRRAGTRDKNHHAAAAREDGAKRAFKLFTKVLQASEAINPHNSSANLSKSPPATRLTVHSSIASAPSDR